jgi:hypothetical protein
LLVIVCYRIVAHEFPLSHENLSLKSYHLSPSKKGMKEAPKCGEKVNPTDTLPKIVVETVNSPNVLVKEVPFDAVETPQAAATTATTTTAHVEGADEEVPVRFIPPQIRTRA